MRSILIPGALALVAACAGGSAQRSNSAATGAAAAAINNAELAAVTPEHVATLSHKKADYLVAEMIAHYIGLAAKRCPGPPQPKSVYGACMSAQVESDFDSAGELSPLCKVHEDNPTEYVFCIIIGADNADLVKVSGGNLAKDINWSDVDHPQRDPWDAGRVRREGLWRGPGLLHRASSGAARPVAAGDEVLSREIASR